MGSLFGGIGPFGSGSGPEAPKLELPVLKIDSLNGFFQTEPPPTELPQLIITPEESLILGNGVAVKTFAKQLTSTFSTGPETTASNVMGWPSATAPQPAPTLSFDPSADVHFESRFSAASPPSTVTTLIIGDASDAIYLTSIGHTVGVHGSASQANAEAAELRLAQIEAEQQRVRKIRNAQAAAAEVFEMQLTRSPETSTAPPSATPSTSSSTARPTTSTADWSSSMDRHSGETSWLTLNVTASLGPNGLSTSACATINGGTILDAEIEVEHGAFPCSWVASLSGGNPQGQTAYFLFDPSPIKFSEDPSLQSLLLETNPYFTSDALIMDSIEGHHNPNVPPLEQVGLRRQIEYSLRLNMVEPIV